MKGETDFHIFMTKSGSTGQRKESLTEGKPFLSIGTGVRAMNICIARIWLPGSLEERYWVVNYL